MDWLEWEPILKKEATALMEKAPDISIPHGLSHLERVWNRCLKLGMRLDGDLEILVAAAYLHDLGRHHGLEVHGAKSAEMAKPVLEKIKFPREKREKVLEAIRLHEQTAPKEHRNFIEAQILYDSDKLDAFGAIGVERWILHKNRRGYSIEEVLERLEKRYLGLHLKESRELANESYAYTAGFFKKLREDLKAE